MPERTPRVIRLLAIGVAQVILFAAALELCAVCSEAHFGFGGGGLVSDTDFLARGYPVPWMVSSHTQSLDLNQKGNRDPGEQTNYSPIVYQAWNPSAACLMLAAALILPPVVIGSRWRLRPLTPPVSQRTRLLGTLLVAAVSGFTAALAEQETTFYLEPSPWRAHPPGRWVVDTDAYRYPVSLAGRARYWIETHIPGGDPGITPDRPARTRVTVIGFTTGALLGCVLLRPLRRTMAWQNEDR